MEEVDLIILQTLNHLGIPLPEDLTSLADFPEELVLLSARKCLLAISGDFQDEDTTEMSEKVLIATKMATQCKKLGFKGDLGYQLFLYPNENDLRRIFMFLIDRLPKDDEKLDSSVPRDRLSAILQSIGKKVSEELRQPWLPPYCYMKAFKVTPGGSWSRDGCCHVDPFDRIPFKITRENRDVKQAFIQYWKSLQLSDVEKEVTSTAESLSEADIILEKLRQSERGLPGLVARVGGAPEVLSPLFDSGDNSAEAQKTLDRVTQILHQMQEKTKSVQAEIANLKKHKKQVIKETEVERSDVKLLEDKKDTASLVLSLLPDKDTNLQKLQMIGEKEAAKIRAVEKEIDEKNTLAIEREKQKIEQNKKLKVIKSLKEELGKIQIEYEKKSNLRVKLAQQYEKRSASKKYVRKRSAYTKRIMEIIGNISKQKGEINKILSDTRELQKEMNSMNGKLDRSFAVVDELVFKDAKKDEHARKAYKLLAYLHTECSDIVTMVNDIGANSREIRELEKHVETERKKKITENLERVYLDLKYEQSSKQRSNKDQVKDPLRQEED